VTDPFELFASHRQLFTTDAAGYSEGRPGYPRRVYDLLVGECGLGPGTHVLEVGPGTGQATAELLRLGASVTAVELGVELAEELRSRYAGSALTVDVGPFEERIDDGRRFDLVVAATSFHWVPAEQGLETAARALRPGGWLALWWTVFGDPNRPDPFNAALQPVLLTIAPELLDPAFMMGANPYSLDSASRIAEIDKTGHFEPVRHDLIDWTGIHTPSELRALFGTFSSWLALPPGRRDAALDTVERLAVDEFAGRVERPYVTSIYLARRSSRD